VDSEVPETKDGSGPSAVSGPLARLAEVAVMAALRNTLTYLVPESLAAAPGMRVEVPLARRKAKGIILGEGKALPAGVVPRPILRLLGDQPLLTPDLLRLGRWIADYYIAPIGEVFRAMLPLRVEARRSARTRSADATMAGAGSACCQHTATTGGQGLESEGAVPFALAPAQDGVLAALSQALDAARFETVLLHGVTGSGKTEVYLRLISRCLAAGRTALMLVPEIALTPAAEAQFLSRFGARVALLHSGLTPKARDEAWWRIRRGEAEAVLGTRSAVFAPLARLGLVIVDEEHDSSYKQGETPRYHGRDVAVMRARLAGALALLGSATPSLESYWNAEQGKYRLATLPERVGGRALATVEIIDMREEFRQTAGQAPVSRRLHQAIRAQLAARQQTMLLLNRRGYSWFLLCRSCGQTLRCVNCSISLTYHRHENQLICHYCGYHIPPPPRCPNCQSQYLYYVGEGTEKLEKNLEELFPGARIARLDRDVARRQGEFQHLLQDFREEKIDLLAGTQLIAKGHHFPGVTLVGVVSADAGLAMPDFRAAERTFQLLAQAAGRAGRGSAPGRVLVQTFYPEHYAILMAAEQNYEVFFHKEMRFRRMMHYPPVTALANVIAQGRTLERAAAAARQVGSFLVPLESPTAGIKILGPSSAPLAKVQGWYRIQFLVKSNSRARLNAILRLLADNCEKQRLPRRAVVIDVDPLSVM